MAYPTVITDQGDKKSLLSGIGNTVSVKLGFLSSPSKKFFAVMALGIIALFSHSSGAANAIDSLQRLILAGKADSTQVIRLNKLSGKYLVTGNYDTALYYSSNALLLAQKLDFQNGICLSHNNMGMIFHKKGDYPKALESFFASLKIKMEMGNKHGIADAYNNIGIIYYSQGDYNKSLENYLASFNIDEKLGDKQSIASDYNNIALIYDAMGKYDKALENYFAALKIADEMKNKEGVSLLYINIGVIYGEQKMYGKALENYSAALKIKNELGDKQSIAAIHNYMGIVYADQKKYAMALENYFTALRLYEETEDKRGIAASDYYIGELYEDKSNYALAIIFFQKSRELYQELGVKNFMLNAYHHLAGLNGKLNNYKEAYKYQQLYSQLKDSTFSDESARQMAEMQTKYETGKKENENELLGQKNRIQQMEITREKEKRGEQLIILIGTLVFTIATSVSVYYRIRYKQRADREKELNHQQKLRFRAVMDAEEKERRRIAQELHDGLGQLLSTVKLNVSAIEVSGNSSGQTPFENSLSLIDAACDEVRTISHNMMPSVLIRLGLLAALRELIRKINASKQPAVNIEANFEQRFDESTEVAIYRIVQEVMNNIIKHAQAKSVSIKLNKSGADLYAEITDDGIGFDTALIKISEGIGWRNIYSRAALLNGTVDITSAPLAGMNVKVFLPDLFIHS